MSFLIKEYNVPFLGIVQLIEASGYDKSFNGTYYATNKALGDFCKNCKSLEELFEKTNEEMKKYFKMQKIIIDGNIESEKGKLRRLEKHISETKYNDWFDKYSTENQLQLEKQPKIKINLK